MKNNKSWRAVIMSSLRTSGAMDTVTGLYGKY